MLYWSPPTAKTRILKWGYVGAISFNLVQEAWRSHIMRNFGLELRSLTKSREARVSRPGQSPKSILGETAGDRGLSRLPRAITALVIAILLWLYVSSTTSPTVYPSIDIELRNLGEGMTLVNQLPKVSVRVQDYSADSQQPVAFIDLTGVAAGTSWIPVQVQGVKNSQVIGVYPSQVKVVLQNSRNKKMPVLVEIVSNGENLLNRARLRSQPSEVTISGSSKSIRRVKQVVAILQPSDLIKGGTVSLTVQALDSNNNPVENVTISPRTVIVRVKGVATPGSTGTGSVRG